MTPNGEMLGQVASLLAQRVLTINVHETFRLDQVSAAHAKGEAGHVRGLLVLDVGFA